MSHPPELRSAFRAAAAMMRDARHIVALVGAGISAESGIPTYRGPDGLWTKFGEPTIDGWQLFCTDPAAWWERAIAVRSEGSEFARAIAAAVPNPGHLALAEMERLGYLKHIITQNIDNLHQEAGSVAITEIHGNRTKQRCIGCARRWQREEVVSDPSTSLRAGDIPPRCPDCADLVKSDTVMFGEPIPRDAIESCHREAE